MAYSERAKLIFVCGGVRSGKNAVGETLAADMRKEKGRLVYIATAQRTDTEMEKRIIKHQNDRERKQEGWVTLERQRNLSECVKHLNKQDTVFLDCLTTWLSNEMFTENVEHQMHHVFDQIIKTIDYLRDASSHVIIISNDVFHEPVPQERLTKHYIKTLGALHQYVVSQANAAISMEHGLPIIKKGEVVSERAHRMGDVL
ncbi:bifunctional adenosylcobinamide kinase/adenosylcobinamide-phosphate guanylyltransferase [Alteribacillus iranensis]|uniref:Adenosylcobinamide kinase n=1 Tax=Alteribacillus iranensis TaxID=930128 RepID=A0A1I1ZMY6_9BACI|nr:bifunctional adenosylcobinamide kinase/adenosylcobinamide-phosphate guanylyltransferase [Alteribacillus iranensis]SFE33051.1 adenosylcobinamide kinase /adenosylcobinamide-phosphate guanylyltransferase [Alteribacillus iranensis]